jgi:uncharacterized protein YggT (Ycf19 family)
MKTAAIRVARVLLWLIYLWVTVTLVLLLLMFLLQLFGANPEAGFVEWVYRSTQRAMAPFRGIFQPVTLSDQSVLDISVLFAMIVYTFVALGLHLLIEWVTRHLHHEERLQEQRDVRAAYAAASDPARVVQLSGPTGVTATAVLQPNARGTAIDLTAAGLAPGQSYTAWLEAGDGGRITTATFQPDPSGAVKLALQTPAALRDTTTFGLTALPRAGETASIDILASRWG